MDRLMDGQTDRSIDGQTDKLTPTYPAHIGHQNSEFFGKALINVLPNNKILDYSTTCIKRPLKGSIESGLLQQVVFKCRFY